MAETRLTQGLIQVYTGDGKGKTTCALVWPSGPWGTVFRSIWSSS